eukprot:TRINITY_DN3553_c0_g1_i1.p1 TRINITY_DN3553_c0_g1~~TRINITY_DN3553_c0_g1_i1.p1  ORF type:complete len:269 (+),score=106.15 TRINITY_DN3553_c0_g1_i1:99-905(+)
MPPNSLRSPRSSKITTPLPASRIRSLILIRNVHLVNFKGGKPLASAPTGLGAADSEIHVSVFQSKKRKLNAVEDLTNDAILAARTSVLEHSAKFELNSSSSQFKYMVGVFDNETNNLRLVEALKPIAVDLESRVRNDDDSFLGVNAKNIADRFKVRAERSKKRALGNTDVSDDSEDENELPEVDPEEDLSNPEVRYRKFMTSDYSRDKLRDMIESFGSRKSKTMTRTAQSSELSEEKLKKSFGFVDVLSNNIEGMLVRRSEKIDKEAQ